MQRLLSNEQQLNLNELLNQDWLNRSWTLQEIVLANDPVIVCGTKTILWRTFVCSILFLNGLQVFEPSVLTKWLAIIALWSDCSNCEDHKISIDSTTQYVQDFHREWTEAQRFASVCRQIKLVLISVAILGVAIVTPFIVNPSGGSLPVRVSLSVVIPVTFIIFLIFLQSLHLNFWFLRELARSR
jgi:hypothetical protein